MLTQWIGVICPSVEKSRSRSLEAPGLSLTANTGCFRIKNPTYCYSLGVVDVVIVVQNLLHFVISLPLLNIYILEIHNNYMSTKKGELCTKKGDNSKLFFARIMPLLDLKSLSDIFFLIQTSH